MDLFLGGYEDWKWNYLKVEVSDASGRSLVTLNGKGIARCHMRHPKSAKGGILVLNNYFREAYSFRDFNIEVLATPDMLNTTALANIKGSVTSRPAWHSYNRCTAQMQRRSWFLFCSFLPSTDCRTTGGTRCHFNFLYRVWLFHRLTIRAFFYTPFFPCRMCGTPAAPRGTGTAAGAAQDPTRPIGDGAPQLAAEMQLLFTAVPKPRL